MPSDTPTDQPLATSSPVAEEARLQRLQRLESVLLTEEPPAPSSSSMLLDRLNYDTLLYMLKTAVCFQSIGAISRTCKRMREACLPLLFRTSRILPGSGRATGRTLPPPNLWPYVQQLVFHGDWQPPDEPRNPAGYMLDDLPLATCLSQMPSLGAIHVEAPGHDPIPPCALAAILSTPQLRAFILDTPPTWTLQPDLHIISPTANLTSVRVLADTYRTTRANPPAEHLIGLLAARLHPVLQELEVPFELVPLPLLSSVEWPRLRTLSFSGESDPARTPHAQLAAMLARAPRLCTLTLDLALRGTVDRQPLFPPGSGSSSTCTPAPSGQPCECPWPDLRALTIAYPDPADELYARLPASLTTLRLRCWPHHFFYSLAFERKAMGQYGWASPVLRAGEALAILRRCAHALPRLRVLELEYEEDGEDAALLQQIPVLFPGLTDLTIYWYRGSGTAEVPVDTMARALAPLNHLRVLRLYLDFPDIPLLFGRDRRTARAAKQTYACALGSAADVLVGALAPSLRALLLLERDMLGNRWAQYYDSAKDRHGRRRAVRSSDVCDEYCLA
ncbi:hypothetical protein C2E23DRAFT_889589 [Lenzites betulinus]|nr:hypothetical protein C2E23DRAFT_889589 [Lenzites betulinus]